LEGEEKPVVIYKIKTGERKKMSSGGRPGKSVGGVETVGGKVGRSLNAVKEKDFEQERYRTRKKVLGGDYCTRSNES